MGLLLHNSGPNLTIAKLCLEFLGFWNKKVKWLHTRPVHKNLFLEFPKMPGSFMLHFDVALGVLLKYRSFIKFWEPPILQGRIHVFVNWSTIQPYYM